MRAVLDLMASRVIAQAFGCTPVIEHLITWVASKSRKLEGFPIPPRGAKNETPDQAEMRLSAHYVTLGRAWVSMALKVNRFDSGVLQREYDKIVEPLPLLLDEMRQKASDRRSYGRKRSAQLNRRERRWGEQLRDWLLAFAARPLEDPADILTERLSEQELYRSLKAYLTPTERQGLEAILSGEPTRGAADRQRRSRARRKLRDFLSQNG
jgi:hypothetical protein